MSIIERTTLWMSAVLLAAFAMVSGTSLAQEAGGAAAGPLEEVVVVGTRRRDRSAADSPVPVDVVTGDDFLAHGDTDMDNLLSSTVPSYNVSQEPISDAATFIRPATLRSLAPDATLVLVNGKRRHRAAVIALLGAGISGGSQGPDLSAIPAIALDRLEVLRDGASAQYGSDAIAGVMNFVLRSNSEALIDFRRQVRQPPGGRRQRHHLRGQQGLRAHRRRLRQHQFRVEGAGPHQPQYAAS